MTSTVDVANIADLLDYVESDDLGVAKHFTSVLQEQLYSTQDASLVGALTERFVQTKSDAILGLLVGLHVGQGLNLFEKLNDCLKRGQYTDVCLVLSSLIQKQPSWLYKLIGTPLFQNLLKCLKTEFDVMFIMHGLIIMSMLIPCVPSIIERHLSDLLEIFIRIASILVTKTGVIPDVCMLHLHAGLYLFFQRLYGMYPNNLLSYLRSSYGGPRSNDSVFIQVVKPMFEFVKFHPGLIADTLRSETSLEKWKTYQPHDVEVECQQISLDPIDVVKEGPHWAPSSASTHSHRDSRDISFAATSTPIQEDRGVGCVTPSNPNSATGAASSESDTCDDSRYPPSSEHQPRMEASSPFLSGQKISSLCSPSDFCGLYTPPSSRPISPSGSTQDVAAFLDARPQTPCFDGLSQGAGDESLVGERKYSSGKEDSSKSFVNSPIPKLHPVKKTRSFGSNDTAKKTFRPWMTYSGGAFGSASAKDDVSGKSSAPATPRGHAVDVRSVRPLSSDLNVLPHELVKHVAPHISLDHTQSLPSSPMAAVNSAFTFNSTSVRSPLANLTEGKDLQASYDAKSVSRQIYKSPYAAAQADCKVELDLPALTASTSTSANGADRNVYQSSLMVNLLKNLLRESLARRPESQFADGNEVDVGASPRKWKSPLLLLDEFIECGATGHSFQYSKIPLTSQLDTDWTYYGGNIPKDEMKILQNQVYLLHIQLQYERNKCQMHMMRNRRLVGKVQKSEDLDNEIATLRNQLSLNEAKLSEMKSATQAKEEQCSLLRDLAAKSENAWLNKQRAVESKNEELAYSLRKATVAIEELEEQVKDKEKEIKKLSHQLFSVEKDMDMIRPKLQRNLAIQEKTDLLSKQLLVQSERQTRIAAKQKVFEMYATRTYELNSQLFVYREEMKNLAMENEHVLSQLDTARSRIVELEGQLAKKDCIHAEITRELECMRGRHRVEMAAVDQRLRSVKKTCQSLQSYITSLYARLEESGRAALASGPEEVKQRKTNSYAGLEGLSIGSGHSGHDRSHRHSLSRPCEDPSGSSRRQNSVEDSGTYGSALK